MRRTVPPVGQLLELAADVASGVLKSKVGDVVALEDIQAAIERNRIGARCGKAVADLTR